MKILVSILFFYFLLFDASAQKSCLLVFGNTTDYTHSPASIGNIENALFYGVTNVSDATLSATYGEISYEHGNNDGNPGTIAINFPFTSSQMTGDLNPHNGNDLQLFLDSIQNSGYDINNYDRVLLFAPGGMPSGDNFAEASLAGRLSVYGTGISSKLFYYLSHELGHNLGLPHTGVGADQYGDRTCIMGYNWTGDYTPCFNAPSVIEGGFLNPFPGSLVQATSSTTVDLYPMGENPATTPGPRIIQIGHRQLLVSYMRDQQPYSYLAESVTHDKVIIHEPQTHQRPYSDRIAILSVGQSYSWNDVTITFNSYGPGNSFANVGVSIPPKGQSPTISDLSTSTNYNTAVTFTLSASDPENDNLYYSIDKQPSNGTFGLGVNAPTFTYQPNQGFVGLDTLTVVVSDLMNSDTAQVIVNVLDTRSTVSIAFASVLSIDENSGSYFQFTIQRVGGDMSSALGVQCEFYGTATFGADYSPASASGITSPNALIYISPNQSFKTVNIFPTDDALLEGAEFINLKVLSSTNYHIDSLNFMKSVLLVDDEAPATHNITYLGNGNTSGTVPPDQTKYQGVPIALSMNTGGLSKVGFTFIGWNTAADGSGTDYLEGETYDADSDLTLYAKYESINTSGVIENTGLGELQIHPNPASHFIELNLENLQFDNLDIMVYTPNGEMIYHSFLSSFHESFKIDVSQWSKGIYFVRVYSGGRETENKILVN